MWPDVIGCLPLVAGLLALPGPAPLALAAQLTPGECVQGASCSQCPSSHFTRGTDGVLLCCPACAAAVLYHGDFPTSWCTCYPGSAAQNQVFARTLRFPGPSSLPSVSRGGQGLEEVQPPGPGEPAFRDALFILNHAGGGGGSGLGPGGGGAGRGGVSPAVQHALTLLADTLEDLHARVSRLEGIIGRIQAESGQDIHRVGTAAPPAPPPPPGARSCPTNFTEIGDHCYYASVWHNYRTIWKEAQSACEGLGAKLAEPRAPGEFLNLTRQLAASSSTTGFSYWTGGLYPGVSWLWFYAGEKVTLGPSYWAETGSSGRVVAPGDTSSGRCLALVYYVNSSNYYYSGDECGFEKYFVCQLLDKNTNTKP